MMTDCKAKLADRRGFSLAEVLLAVAILVILFALLVPNLVKTRKQLRQKELDAKAEIVYAAVQNQLVKLRAGGNAGKYALPAQLSNALTEDLGVELAYFCSGDATAAAIFSGDEMDATLQNGYWIVEYDPATGYVYAVFYSEKRDNLAANYANSVNRPYFDTLRFWNERLAAGAEVGYYDGRGALLSETTPSGGGQTAALSPDVSVENGEKLTAFLQCTVPDGAGNPVFTFKLYDEHGHCCTETYTVTGGGRLGNTTPGRLEKFGRSYSIKVVLDDLSAPGSRFASLYGENPLLAEGERLVPGDQLTMELTVSCPNGLVQSGSTDRQNPPTANSLFADDSAGATAAIRCGRHLQNLDAGSGVRGVTAAVQKTDVVFSSEDAGGWLTSENYKNQYFNGLSGGKPNFKPIENDELKSYSGALCRIAGLNCAAEGDAGLFAALGDGAVLKSVRMSGCTVSGARAGALAGSVSGGVAIERCTAYLERGDYQDKTDANVWISGETAGGLVGALSGGTLRITDSFAATVLSGTASAGGLVGAVAGGQLHLSTSYADCYLTGARTGGLVGSGAAASVQSCYAAGFQSATVSAAGLVNGAVTGALARSYTVCDLGTEALGHATAASASSVSEVYFLSGAHGGGAELGTAIGATGSAALCAMLNGDSAAPAFQIDTKGTVAYRLRGQALDNYIFPRLTVNGHYGDWQSGFQAGALVYYEKYIDEKGAVSYGFYGAGVNSALNDTLTAVGDGYGVVFDHSAITRQIAVRVGGNTYDLSYVQPYQVETADGGKYDVFPLPVGIVCAAPTEAGFYDKIAVAVTSAGETTESTYSFNPHFAKTAALMPDPTQEPLAPTEEKEKPIIIRTARHLYALSLYYDAYWHDATLHCFYEQERDISYSAYDWTRFSTYGAAVTAQAPIGRAPGMFQAGYNGKCHTVSDISFVATAKSDANVGMFGSTDCLIQNVVLVTDFDPKNAQKHCYVQRAQNIGANETVSIGVLVGCNRGTVYNCAVAGYYIAGSDGTIHAYANSTIYVGGLVGRNLGSIGSSTADCPTIRLSSLDATVALGGLVGRNEAAGYIRSCYALGHIEVAEARRGDVAASGFAGANVGQIRSSYCAVSLVTNGDAASYGFAPRTGLVSADSYYLNAGTYYYAGALRDYTSVASATSATPITYQKLKQMRGGNAAAYSLHHINTAAASYPFPAVLRNGSETLVHYGDWQDVPALGTFGVFYWEHEVDGTNNGYHISFLGTEVGSATAGTTLCTAHDDGGRIEEYGYGYYALEGQESEVTLLTSGISFGDALNTAAKAELEKQMFGYRFYPHTTRYGTEGDYLYLSNGEATTGTWTLRFGSGETCSFAIAPFFANAMQRLNYAGAISVVGTDGTETDHAQAVGSQANPYEVRSVQQLEYINWNYAEKNCSTLVYGEENKANVGNFKQFPYLQYATVLTKGTQSRSAVEALRPAQNWKQSHDLHGTYEVQETDALGKPKTAADGSPVMKTERLRGYTPIAGMATSTPVSGGTYRNILYAWFGGTYDGQSYKIQNLEIASEAFTVGLFGATAGATLKNIIMFSDNGSAVQRSTLGKTGTYGSKTVDFTSAVGAYSLGGLVGIAYEYSSGAITNKIENCAIAGYQVIDRSTNQQGAGTANVGGLIRLANMNLERCASVSDIVIDCTHDYGHAYWGSYIRVGGLAGSAGAPDAAVSLNDCYTGGSIQVSQRALEELPTAYAADGFAYRNNGDVGMSLNIFISGMIGGSYAPNISNFTNRESNAPDGTANINNCYTFTNLPDLEGSIRAVSLFASQADRYCRNTKINLTNCWYLDTVAEGIDYPKRSDPATWPAYFFTKARDARMKVTPKIVPQRDEHWEDLLLADPADLTAAQIKDRNTLLTKYQVLVISDEEYLQMLDGDLHYLRYYLDSQGSDGNTMKSKANRITYEQMVGQTALADGSAFIDKLNAGRSGDAAPWGWVTVTEGSGESTARIDGKYSFSDNSAQTGKNYPFPTVVRQKDLTFGGNVNVHYGAWPTNGAYWENGLDTMDVFTDMTDEGEAEKVFTLHLTALPTLDDGVTFSAAGIAELTNWTRGETAEDGSVTYASADAGLRFTFSIADKAELVGVTLDRGKKTCAVTLRALELGSVNVSEDGSGAAFNLSISAALQASVDQPALMLYRDVPETVTFTAVDAGDGSKHFETLGTWQLAPASEADSGAFETELEDDAVPNVWKITGLEPGQRTLSATVVYPYHGAELRATVLFEATVKGEIGLSDGTAYALALRRAEGEIAGAAEEMTLEDAPQGPELFLFAPTVDEDLADFQIDQITVTPAGGGAVTVYDRSAPENARTDAYRVIFTDEPEPADEGTDYRFWTAALRRSADAAATVGVTVRLTDPNGESRYTLTLEGLTAKRYGVSFLPDGGVGRMFDAGCDGGDYTLPACGFVKTGYAFAGWLAAGAGEPIPAGGTAEISGDTAFTAAWTPNRYTLRFDPNLGSGTADDLTLSYDEETALPLFASLGLTGPEGAGVFLGWNTSPGGDGLSFDDGAAVQNLSDAEGAVVTLYAQWSSHHTLTLLAGSEETAFADEDVNGAAQIALVAFDGALERDGWTLEGWYTERTTAQSSVKILNADGSIAAGAGDTAGVTENGVFALTDDLTLYARWSRTAFVQVGVLQETGRYLIASGASEETLQLMTLQSGAKLGAAEADVFHGTFLDGGGSEHTDAAYIDAPAENAKWTASYSSAAGFIGYRFEQELGGTAYYLRRDNDTTKELAVRTDYLYNGGLSDRYIWHYDEIPNMWAQKDGRNMTLGLADGKWKTGEGLQSRIFREQTIYTFDPDAFSS